MRPSRKRNRTTKRQECSTPEGVCEQATRSFTDEIIGSRKLIWRPRSTNGLRGDQWRSPPSRLLGSQRVAPQQRRFVSEIYLPTKPKHNNRNGTCLSGDVQVSAIRQLLGEATV